MLVRRAVRVASFALLLAVLPSCKGSDAYRRRTGAEYEAEVASWLASVRELGASGMWLVTRGYHPGDDLVATATDAEYSHASLLDLERGEVIEAISGGVSTRPLADFLAETHRLMLIRPRGFVPDAGVAAVARARTMIGQGYDFTGIVGVPDPDRFDCSELAAWAWELPTGRLGPQHVLHPTQLVGFGDVLYQPGPRDKVPDPAPAQGLTPVQGSASGIVTQ